jgi:hypothetical protein
VCGGVDNLLRVVTDILGRDFAHRALDRLLHTANAGHKNRGI